jgi:crossover junction endodeoxyribonuclease RuvC
VAERLLVLHSELTALLTELDPDVVVVERVFFQVNAKTAMAVGQASGLALLAAAAAGCEVAQYTANEVKLGLVGYGAATKEQVQRMVAQVLGLGAVGGPPDVADALALAICHLTTVSVRRAVDAALGEDAVRGGDGALHTAADAERRADVASIPADNRIPAGNRRRSGS